MSHATFFRPRATQSGAVLVTGLVFLLVLTMFVLALVRSGTLEERMARNARDQHMAREAAEAILRDGETVLFNKAPFDPYDSSAFSPKCPNGLCFKPGAASSWDSVDWKDPAVTRGFSAATLDLAEITTQPRYIVEMITPPAKASSSGDCDYGVVRLTARGQGNGGATSFVQTTVRFRVYSKICD
ncbi:PilX N-terminal domain-containing pilus assembly protein [Massilia sp. DJPM01]|uniref:pilus assembly PilX family protein n=1 Tax=Massilia sp. DJPM01 TaxID=3024404 RepID=UPI00259E40B6|nr:PilX N-terminal domain-containing pilus assembly protein [Massilia sp. DJPM01]MDM5177506.1 PilX N-terminal domain-containing pilus assembly protein [Massilia sp. DJPM01]